MALEVRGINQRVELSGIYLSSSLSFSVYYNSLRWNSSCIYSFFRWFLFFFIPVEGLCCRPKYWANIIHRFDDQNSLTSKCIENWALFERLNFCRASDRHYRHAPEGVPNPKPSKASSFFVQFKDAYISTFQRPD